jgi:hypothetical protein
MILRGKNRRHFEYRTAGNSHTGSRSRIWSCLKPTAAAKLPPARIAALSVGFCQNLNAKYAVVMLARAPIE